MTVPRTARRAVAACATCVAGALAPASGRAQIPDAALPRGGEAWVEVRARQDLYDRTFLPGGARVPLGDPLAAPLDRRFFPELAALDSAVAALLSALGEPPAGGGLSLGRATFDLQAEVTRIDLGLTFGLTRWLAVHASMPLVRARVFARMGLDTTDAGAGPFATALGGDPEAFFAGLDTAIAQLDTLIASGTLDPDRKAEAEALRDRARTYASGLAGLRNGFTLWPVDAGPLGNALHRVHDGLAAGFLEFGIAIPELRLARPFGADAAAAALADSLGMPPFGDADTGYRLGDVRTGVLVQPVNTLRDRPRSGLWDPGLRLTLGLARTFPTGSLDRPDRPYDLPTGRGSGATEADLVLDLAAGARFALTLAGHATAQDRHALRRRVAPFDSALVGPNREAVVVRRPGRAWSLAVAPRVHLTDAVSVALVAAWLGRARDRYAYADAPLPGVDPDALGRGTSTRARWIGFEVRYRSTGRWGEGRRALPVEASFGYVRTSSADGLAPATERWTVTARFAPVRWTP